jgi:hypothetical protein
MLAVASPVARANPSSWVSPLTDPEAVDAAAGVPSSGSRGAASALAAPVAVAVVDAAGSLLKLPVKVLVAVAFSSFEPGDGPVSAEAVAVVPLKFAVPMVLFSVSTDQAPDEVVVALVTIFPPAKLTSPVAALCESISASLVAERPDVALALASELSKCSAPRFALAVPLPVPVAVTVPPGSLTPVESEVPVAVDVPSPRALALPDDVFDAETGLELPPALPEMEELALAVALVPGPVVEPAPAPVAENEPPPDAVPLDAELALAVAGLAPAADALPVDELLAVALPAPLRLAFACDDALAEGDAATAGSAATEKASKLIVVISINLDRGFDMISFSSLALYI